MSEPTKVPCNGCRACCIGDSIILHPDEGDDPSIYLTETTVHPLSGAPVIMLAHKENGECVYLSEHGCANYENRPLICRTYDCRKQFLSLTKAMKRALVAKGLFAQEQIEQGKKRVGSLTSQERLQCIDRRNARAGNV